MFLQLSNLAYQATYEHPGDKTYAKNMLASLESIDLNALIISASCTWDLLEQTDKIGLCPESTKRMYPDFVPDTDPEEAAANTARSHEEANEHFKTSLQEFIDSQEKYQQWAQEYDKPPESSDVLEVLVKFLVMNEKQADPNQFSKVQEHLNLETLLKYMGKTCPAYYEEPAEIDESLARTLEQIAARERVVPEAETVTSTVPAADPVAPDSGCVFPGCRCIVM